MLLFVISIMGRPVVIITPHLHDPRTRDMQSLTNYTVYMLVSSYSQLIVDFSVYGIYTDTAIACIVPHHTFCIICAGSFSMKYTIFELI